MNPVRDNLGYFETRDQINAAKSVAWLSDPNLNTCLSICLYLTLQDVGFEELCRPEAYRDLGMGECQLYHSCKSEFNPCMPVLWRVHELKSDRSWSWCSLTGNRCCGEVLFNFNPYCCSRCNPYWIISAGHQLAFIWYDEQYKSDIEHIAHSAMIVSRFHIYRTVHEPPIHQPWWLRECIDI